MSQILNFAGERSMTQWSAAQGKNHGARFMAMDSVWQDDKVNEPGQ